jgi:hypothetical protein
MLRSDTMDSSEAIAVLQPDNCTGQRCGTPAGHGGIAPRRAPPEPVFCSPNDTPNYLQEATCLPNRIVLRRTNCRHQLSGELGPLQQNQFWR